MDPSALQKHVFRAYVQIGYGMAAIGFAFPVAVFVAGRFDNQSLLGSISAYYWAGTLIARTWFVGGLFALAALLYLYKGFSSREDVALNIAALFGLGVAVFPMCQENCGWITLHGFCAVSLFACLVYVVWFCADDTLRFLPGPKRTQYRLLYKSAGLVMAVSPLIASILNHVLVAQHSFVFFLESVGIWAFALFWWFKISELEASGAIKKAIAGQLDMTSTQ